jgi:molybdopterin/thiamine biosynthesis adenylyltransferase
MRVKASLPSYRKIELEIDEKKTIGDLKKRLCMKLGIEANLTKLLLNGKVLSEKSPLSKLRRIEGDVIVDYLWARHLLLWGIQGQQKIRSASVLLAGAGALGNEVAKNLAMLGVGQLFFVDKDTVELSNTSRMIFFNNSSLGKNKAEVLAKNLHERYPFVETAAYRGELESLPLKVYLDSDVIISGLDNVVSRIYLSQISRRYSIPLVDGGIMGLTARVQAYIPPEAACPTCMFPGRQYSSIVGLRNPCDAPIEQETVPSFSTSISLVSSIVAQETIKIILGFENYRQRKRWPETSGEPLGSVLFIDLKSNRYTPMPLKRNETCFVCGKDGTARKIAKRIDLQLSERPLKKMEAAIREATHLQKESLLLFSETVRGERRLNERSASQLRRGDYVRVITENGMEEADESVCRLT